MNNFNIMAVRGKINDVAQRVWLRMRFFDPLFCTRYAVKTKMLSSLDKFQLLTAEIKKNILR